MTKITISLLKDSSPQPSHYPLEKSVVSSSSQPEVKPEENSDVKEELQQFSLVKDAARLNPRP